jgi:sulfatase modifying factor 1
MPNRRDFLTHLACASGAAFVRGDALGVIVPGVSVDARVGAPSGAQSLSFKGVSPGEERVVDATKLCWCPPGQFLMGSAPSETDHRADEAQVGVTLTRGFWIGKFEVTQGQWRRVVGEFPGKKPTPQFGEGEDFPVYWINFYGAEAFCNTSSERARRAGALPTGWEFRLPTEAQWEYACRARTTTATSFGAQLGRHQANFQGEPLNGGRNGPALRRSATVGSYPANPWGICDMHGNVFEWCRDWYHARLPGGIDPDLHDVKGMANGDGTYSRVRRGGAWDDDGWACRSALRLRYEPERTSDHIGFRVAVVQS